MPTYVFLSSASRTACTQLIFKEHGCMYVCITKVTKTFACFFHKFPCAPTYLTAPTGRISQHIVHIGVQRFFHIPTLQLFVTGGR